MKTKINARQSQIVQWVEKGGKISVTELATLTGVSPVTIRKDLSKLDEYGILSRYHGFAIRKNTANITNRLSIHYEIKRRIAKRAAALVADNETILVATGSTCALLAEEIATTKPNVTIITNSIYILNRVSKLGRNKIILLGGEYQNDAQVLVGSLVREGVKQYYADKIFLGSDGYRKGIGWMGSDAVRTDAIRAMASSASKRIMLVDSSKFSRAGLIVQFQDRDITEIVTDNGIPDDIRNYFSTHNIPLILVPQETEMAK